MGVMREKLGEIMESLAYFRENTPEQMKAFHELLEATEKEGVLDKKTKELISVALAVIKQCVYCIAFHVKNALDAGATKEEILEAAWVAVLMGGGPALMYAQYVIKALEEFGK